MRQAPISKAFPLTPVRASRGAQPFDEERGITAPRHPPPGILLFPLVAADTNKYEKMQIAFVGRWDGLQDSLRSDSPKVQGLHPTHGSHV